MSDDFPVFAGAETWSSPPRDADRAAPGVVVLHGFTGNPTSVRPLGEALAARGHAVSVPRLPGHGTDWRDLARTRYGDWRGAADRAVSEMLDRAGRVVVVGLSMGGLLALDVGSARADVAGVVAINPPYLDREGLLARMAPLMARFIPVVTASMAGLAKNDAARPGVDERAYDRVPTRAAQSLLEALPRVREQLAGLRRPLLVVASKNDHSVDPANARALAAATGAELLLLERSYHLATLDVEADLVVERIAQFIERLGAEPAAARA